MKYERDGKYLCKNCARRYDGKSPIESDEELKRDRIQERMNMVIKKCPKCGGTVVYSPVCRGMFV